MKVEIELSVDSVTGEPIIKFRHHDKSDAIEQVLLNVFINKARGQQLKIVHIGGYLECGTKNSWEDYQIKINNE